MCPLKAKQTGPILCYVTDRLSLRPSSAKQGVQSLVEKIEETVSAGVDWVQLREKDLTAAGWTLLARSALDGGARTAKSRILLNDRLDVAVSVRAGGLHLSENGFPLSKVREFVKSSVTDAGFLIGVSCHSMEAAQIAARDGADYIHFGPIFETPSKAGFGQPQGLERLEKVCQAIPIPVIAIGGITLSNADSCRKAGARGIAAIRLFQDAQDIEKLVGHLRNLLS